MWQVLIDKKETQPNLFLLTNVILFININFL